MADIATIGFRVDSSPLAQAAAALDKMSASGRAADAASQALGKSFRASAGSFSATAAAINVAANSTRTLETGARTAATELGKTGQAATAAAQRVASGTQKIAGSVKAIGDQTKLTAYQAQQLGFQLNDLFVQILSGGNPLTALVQQGSQLAGTFGGIGGALRAVLTLFNPVAVAIGAVAASVGSLAYSYIAANNEAAGFARALALTGNAAGITEGQYRALTASIAEATNTTIGSSRDTLLALANTGQLSGEALRQAAIAAQLLSKVTDKSADEIVKDFEKATDGVGRFAEGLNRTYNFLTAEQLKYIKSLEDQGNTQQALAQTLALLNVRLQEGAGKVGIFGSAWQGLKNVLDGVRQSLIDINREKTPEERIAAISAELKRRAEGGFRFLPSGESNADLEARLAIERENVRLGERAADNQARTTEREKARIEVNNRIAATLSRQKLLAKELADAEALLDKAGASRAQREQLIAQIREKYATKGAGSGDADQIRRAQMAAATQAIQDELDKQVGAFRAADQILSASRTAQIITEREYYDAKRALIGLESDAEVQALEQKNDRLRQEKATGAEQIRIASEIAQNEARIAVIRADASAKLEVLSIQDAAATKRIKVGFEEAEAAAHAYLDALKRAQQSDLKGIGLGNQERQRRSGRQQIEDRYTEQRQRLESERRRGQITPKQYTEELDRIRRFQADALSSYDDYFDRVLRKQQNWQVGMSEALNNYLDDAKNTAKQAEKAFNDGLNVLEDGLTKALNGEFKSYRDFFGSLERDFLNIVNRMIAKAITARIAEKLFGVDQVGGGVTGGILGKLFGSFFGPEVDSSAAGVGMAAWYGAKGGIVGNRGVEPFASGGIVNQPTLFRHGGSRLGVMGEAGTEGILPLRRDAQGRLGVMAAGSQQQPISVQMTVVTPDAESFRRSEGQVASRLSGALSRARRYA